MHGMKGSGIEVGKILSNEEFYRMMTFYSLDLLLFSFLLVFWPSKRELMMTLALSCRVISDQAFFISYLGRYFLRSSYYIAYMASYNGYEGLNSPQGLQ